jgi:hypothetical protein
VSGIGTGASYSFTDRLPESGTWYYWLLDVSSNGAQSLAMPTPLAYTVEVVYLPMLFSK